jgi:formylglycine-generating enzyme required for sulfatase activity
VARLHGLELPTEAQWEYFARAGVRTRYSGGDTWLNAASNENLADGQVGEHGFNEFRRDDNIPLTCNVSALPANTFGLVHVIGNVAEFCRDALTSYAFPAQGRDGLRGEEGDSIVVRGGAYDTSQPMARFAARSLAPRHLPSETIGIRMVRMIDP